MMDSDAPATEWQQPPFDQDTVRRVWIFAQEIPGNDAELWRKDAFGAWIYRLDYGNRHSSFGWHIAEDSGNPESGLASLRPLQWQNYIDQVASVTQSRVTADGLRNVRRLL
ncbi:MAG: hypothetical protein R3F19_18865 [Verrucomicrobiales bacterium]